MPIELDDICFNRLGLYNWISNEENDAKVDWEKYFSSEMAPTEMAKNQSLTGFAREVWNDSN